MIIINPISMIICFLSLGIDIAVFFLLIRQLFCWRRIRFLEGLNNVGKPLVDGLTAQIGGFFQCRLKRSLSNNGKVMVSIGILSLFKFILFMLLGVFQ